jgi:predicted small metal-binding protein
MKRRKLAMPSFKCADIGMECSYETSANTESELMAKIAEHGANAHDIKTIPEDMKDKIQKAIKK